MYIRCPLCEVRISNEREEGDASMRAGGGGRGGRAGDAQRDVQGSGEVMLEEIDLFDALIVSSC
jgi:hypothetical protein